MPTSVRPQKWVKTYAELTQRLKCSQCGEEKEATNFSPRKERPRGYESRCKECNSKRALKYHNRNRDKILPIMRTRAKTRYLIDPTIAKYWGRTRKKRIKRATPPWADIKAIRKFYAECPDGFHVDHIIPLINKKVCGLHTIENLQYLPAKENLQKRNKF